MLYILKVDFFKKKNYFNARALIVFSKYSYGTAPGKMVSILPFFKTTNEGVPVIPSCFAKEPLSCIWFWYLLDSTQLLNFSISGMFILFANFTRKSKFIHCWGSGLKFLNISFWYSQYLPCSAAQCDATAPYIDPLYSSRSFTTKSL